LALLSTDIVEAILDARADQMQICWSGALLTTGAVPAYARHLAPDPQVGGNT
jgi:hypothetical protein